MPNISLVGAIKSSEIRVSNHKPPAKLGVNGDYFLDLTTSDLYYKANGTYSSLGKLKGDGVAFRTGLTPAISSIGNDGDVYLNLATAEFFHKTNGQYVLLGRLQIANV